MFCHHEHPRCRKIILTFLDKFDCSLDKLLQRKDVYLSKRQKIQAHKMLKESKFRTGLQIYKEERQERLMRSVGMIQ